MPIPQELESFKLSILNAQQVTRFGIHILNQEK